MSDAARLLVRNAAAYWGGALIVGIFAGRWPGVSSVVWFIVFMALMSVAIDVGLRLRRRREARR